MSLALGKRGSKIVQHSEVDAGEAHVVPELLAMSVREVVHRFALRVNYSRYMYQNSVLVGSTRMFPLSPSQTLRSVYAGGPVEL